MTRHKLVNLGLFVILFSTALIWCIEGIAQEGQPVGIVRATIERDEGPPCECEGVLFEDSVAERIGDRFGFQTEGLIEGRCESAPSDDPEIVESFCFAGVYGEGQMIGTYSGANSFGLVRGLWQATYDQNAPATTPMSQVFASGAGPGGPKNRGKSTEGLVDWSARPSRDQVKEALECSRFLREIFGSIIWPDPRHDLVFHGAPVDPEPAWIDVRQIWQEEGSLWMAIEPFDLIPPSPSETLRYQVYFDTDLDSTTGVPIREDVGSEYTVWIGFDAPFAEGVWGAALFRANEVGGFDQILLLPEDAWEIGASRIRLQVPLSEMGNPPAFTWLCLSATLTAADYSPNEGAGFWLTTEAL
ncbi:hypothetical protein KAJ02_13195 [Candidatus Bipolaricaulota bacterium]|nr:hypothetical protein [Candidatus Bipolaricaulota bacterium]